MRPISLTLLLAAVAAPASATVEVGDPLAGLQAMRELNLIVLHDMAGAGTVEGKAFVGGNLANSTPLTVGGGSKTQAAAPSKRPTMSVVGNVSGGTLKIQNGANGDEGLVGNPAGLRVGGSMSSGG